MESKKGYFIDIVKGKVETAEEHDERVRAEFAEALNEELANYDFWWYQEFNNNGGMIHEETLWDIICGVLGNYEKGAEEE